MFVSSLSLLFAVAAAALPREEYTRAADSVDTSTLKGKWLYGYQGWFRKPGSGVNNHWAPDGTPGPGNVGIDFIPDVSEYPAECLFDTDFTLPNGSKAQFYDNTCEGVVDLHFKWMQQVGVDGILVQRFLGSTDDDSFITVLKQVQAAAEKYGRGFIVEYDVSGGDSSQGSVADEVLADYNSSIKQFTSSSAYIHQDGKPVLFTYGIGYTDNSLSASDAEDLVNQMKSAGTYAGLGTTIDWADSVNDNSEWAPVFKAANLVSPWTVGVYSNEDYPSHFTDTQKPDAQLCESLGIDYAPVIWPGTSAYHTDSGEDPAKLDYYPRFNGSFYESQANSVMDLDPMFIFTAMFDEVNEGTGSLACLTVDQLPTNEVFVGIDNNFTTDHYLELGGQLATNFHNLQQ